MKESSEIKRGYVTTKKTDNLGIEITKERVSDFKAEGPKVSEVGKHEALRFKASNTRALKKDNNYSSINEDENEDNESPAI